MDTSKLQARGKMPNNKVFPLAKFLKTAEKICSLYQRPYITPSILLYTMSCTETGKNAIIGRAFDHAVIYEELRQRFSDATRYAASRAPQNRSVQEMLNQETKILLKSAAVCETDSEEEAMSKLLGQMAQRKNILNDMHVKSILELAAHDGFFDGFAAPTFDDEVLEPLAMQPPENPLFPHNEIEEPINF